MELEEETSGGKPNGVDASTRDRAALRATGRRRGLGRFEVESSRGQPGGEAMSNWRLRAGRPVGNCRRAWRGDSRPKSGAGNRTREVGRFRTEASFGYPDGVWDRKDSGPSHHSGNWVVIASRSLGGHVTRATGRRASRGFENESRLGEPGSDEGFVRRRCGRQARKLEQAGSAET